MNFVKQDIGRLKDRISELVYNLELTEYQQGMFFTVFNLCVAIGLGVVIFGIAGAAGILLSKLIALVTRRIQ